LCRHGFEALQHAADERRLDEQRVVSAAQRRGGRIEADARQVQRRVQLRPAARMRVRKGPGLTSVTLIGVVAVSPA
jgi:hypothetical protein